MSIHVVISFNDRVVSKKAQSFLMSTHDRDNDSENFYEMEKVVEDFSFFLAVLRLLSYKLAREPSSSEHIDTLVQVEKNLFFSLMKRDTFSSSFPYCILWLI